MAVVLILMVIALAAVWLFAHFRNKQADRNDNRREKLSEKREELLKRLRKRDEAG